MDVRRPVAVGALTAPVLHRIAVVRDIDMPLVSAVVDLLDGRVQIDELLHTMLSRPPGDEED
jgi:glycerol-3-phosphate dehydrogenase